MKKVCILIDVLLALAGNTFADNLSVGDITMTPGENSQISIELNNSDYNYISFQFDLELPEGISVAQDSNGNLEASINADRATDGTSFTAKEIGNNKYRFLAYTNGAAFSGNSGSLVNITLTASEEIAGSTSVAVLTAQKFTTTATSQQRFADTSFHITVKATASSVQIGNLFYDLDIKTHTAKVVASVTNVTSITIPAAVTYNGISYDVTEIGNGAFAKCNNLTSVTVDIPYPIDIDDDAFPNRQNATLYVPARCYGEYLGTDYWSEFKEIIDGADVNCDGEIDEADIEIVADIMAGWSSDSPFYYRADVNQDGKINITDIVIINNTELEY